MTSKDGLIRSNLMGKRCTYLGTKVLLWNGEIKNVEDIKIGDNLIGNDGEKRTVLKLFNGTDNMYKIKQKSGEDYIVNSEHTLTLKFIDNKKLYWMKTIRYLLLCIYWRKKIIIMIMEMFGLILKN